MMIWRRWRLIGVMVLVGGMAACGDDSAVVACEANCDAQGRATGCTDVASTVQLCKALCGPLLASFNGECTSKAEAQYNCMSKLSYSCASGGNLPQPDDKQACKAEAQAFAPCVQQQQR